MPELPEVETIARQLARRILGRHVTELELIRPDLIGPDGRRAAATLRGQRIVSIDRHGKRLIISLQDGAMLVFHLGMTGRLLLARSGSPLPAHTHLRVRLGSAGELRFCDPRRFGRVWIVPRGSRWTAPALTPLGPDALRISSGRFQQLCRRRRAIKALLLDQRAIAGLGNIYSDEVLFRAGIHPATPACALSQQQVAELHRQIRQTLTAAIRSGGSTVGHYRQPDGSIGRYQQRHLVYGRAGQPCRACGSTIEKAIIAARTTHLCPACQPRPRARKARPPQHRPDGIARPGRDFYRFDFALTIGRFVARPNRFLAIVEIDGRTHPVHVRSSGRMRELLRPGRLVAISPADRPDPKTRFDLRLARTRYGWCSVDATLANRVVHHWLLRRSLSGFGPYRRVQREPASSRGRFDFALTGGPKPWLIEVKSCSLTVGDYGLFPDAPTARGRGQLSELARLARAGQRCAVIWVLWQRRMRRFWANPLIDPAFADNLQQASQAGVRLLPIRVSLCLQGVRLLGPARLEPLDAPTIAALARQLKRHSRPAPPHRWPPAR